MITNEITEYEQQALDFLANTQTTMSVERTLENNCPNWDNEEHIHGDEYKITFQRGRKSASLHFWNSLQDKRDGNTPTAYHVLANISIDMNTNDMTFDEFCSDFGYDTDSIKASKTYAAVMRQAINLRRIWSDAREIDLLQEIQ